MIEREVNKQVQDYIFAMGGYVLKTIVTNRNGAPDIIACYKGRFFAVEGKAPGKLHTVSALQRDHITQIINAGGIAIVADNLRTVIDAMSNIETFVATPPAGPQEFTL